MPYQTPTYQLLKELSVNENVGVHAREVEQRRQRFGANVFEEVRRVSIARLFLEQVKDPMILILCAAVLISLFLQEVVDAGIILLVIVLVAAASVSGSYAGDAVGAVMGMLAVILLALLAVIALLIVYSAKVIGSLNAAKHAVETGVFQKKASMFVAVLGFIMAGYTLIDLYGTFVFRGWLAMLSGICTAGAQIIFGICIINYNRKVREMTETPQA